MFKQQFIRFLPVVALLAAGALSACDDAGSQQQGMGYGQGQAVPVTAVTLHKATVVNAEKLPGRTTAYKVAEIRPQVSGVIMKRTFTEGGYVKEGQQLYQIDPALFRAAYESAKAELQRARANVKSVQAKERRYAELVDIDAVSKQEYDDIEASLAQAKADIAVADANVTRAKVNLDYTKVYSPISGRIGKSSVTEGALVTASQTQVLTNVTQLDPIYVDMTQSSTDLMRIRNRMGGESELPVTLTLEGGQAYEHEGKLQFSDVTVDETTGSVQLRAIFPNPDRVLLPGLFVQASVKLDEEQELLVPQKAAVRTPDGQLVVWRIAEDGTVNPAPIQTVREYNDQWIVSGGVQEGDVIVTEGFQKIRPGAKVQPTSGSNQAEAKAMDKAAGKVDEEGAPQSDAGAMAPAAPAEGEGGDEANAPQNTQQDTQE